MLLMQTSPSSPSLSLFIHFRMTPDVSPFPLGSHRLTQTPCRTISPHWPEASASLQPGDENKKGKEEGNAVGLER